MSVPLIRCDDTGRPLFHNGYPVGDFVERPAGIDVLCRQFMVAGGRYFQIPVPDGLRIVAAIEAQRGHMHELVGTIVLNGESVYPAVDSIVRESARQIWVRH